MGIVRKLAGETAVYGMSSIIGRFLNWWLVPYYSRIFIPEEYGIVTNLYSYVAFLLIILTFGMETGFFRFANKDLDTKKIYSTSAFSLFATSIFFIFLIFIYSGDIAIWFEYPNGIKLVRWLAIIIACDASAAIPFAYLRLQGKAVRFASLKLISIFFNIFFNIFFLTICPAILKSNPQSIIQYIYNPEMGVEYVFISNLITSIMTIILLTPQIRMIKFDFDWKVLRQMASYSFPILLVGLAGMINQNVDKILIPKLIPENQNPMQQLGIYGANYKLAVLMTMFIQAFRYSFEPFFFSQEKKGDSKHIYALIMKYFVIFGLLIFLGITLFIDVVKIVIDENYYSGLSIVPIVLIANLFMGIYFNLSLWYKLTDKTRYGAYIAAIGAVVTLTMNIFLIPVIGYIGSAIAVLVCFVLMVIISYLLGQKFYHVNYDIKRMGFYLLLAVLLYFISWYLKFPGEVLKYALNTMLFSVFLVVVYSIERKEFKTLLNRSL